jgi:hypothetical protein
MLFRVFFQRFNEALIAFLVLVPTFVPFHTSTRRIYLSHGTEVKVFDAASGTALRAVSGLNRNHGLVVLDTLVADSSLEFFSTGFLTNAFIAGSTTKATGGSSWIPLA